MGMSTVLHDYLRLNVIGNYKEVRCLELPYRGVTRSVTLCVTHISGYLLWSSI